MAAAAIDVTAPVPAVLEGNRHASPAADELAIVIDLDKTRHPLTT